MNNSETLPENQINFFCNADEKSLFKDIREIVNFNFDADKKLHLFAKEFKKMSKTEMFRKIHITKFNLLCNEVKRKLATNSGKIFSEIHQINQSVLINLLKKNVESSNNAHQESIAALIEGYTEKFVKEPSQSIFINTIEFQIAISLIFAFFLKVQNNLQKLYQDFFNAVCSIDQRKFCLVIHAAFKIYAGFKGINNLPLEFKLYIQNYNFPKVQQYMCALIHKILNIQPLLNTKNLQTELTYLGQLSNLKSNHKNISMARKIFEFYFLTSKFDLDLAILLKNNPKKHFKHPFEEFFRKNWLCDYCLFYFYHIFAKNCPSNNQTELSFFHQFFIITRLNLQIDDTSNFENAVATSNKSNLNWEIEFVLKTLIDRKMLNRKFGILVEKMPLFKNLSKTIILNIIGCYLMDKFSIYKEVNKKESVDSKKSKVYEKELFGVFFEEIEQISNHFDTLCMITFDN